MKNLNKSGRDMDGTFTVVAGDDLTVEVAFTKEGRHYCLGKDDKAELVIHMPDDEERIVSACSVRKHGAQFYLSGEDTKELLDANPCGIFHICVRVTWAYGGRDTPIYRQLLLIVGC